MALLTLFFESTSKLLAAGQNLPLGYSLPHLRQEDILNVELSVIKLINEMTSPRYELVNLAGYSLRISIGTAGSVLASQNSFALDATNTKFVGLLNLNTAGINALTDGQTGISFEILVTDAAGGIYGQKFPCFIDKAVFLSGAVVNPPADIALGRLEAQRLYFPNEGAAGQGFIMKSGDGLKRIFVYLDNDGSLQTPPIT